MIHLWLTNDDCNLLHHLDPRIQIILKWLKSPFPFTNYLTIYIIYIYSYIFFWLNVLHLIFHGARVRPGSPGPKQSHPLFMAMASSPVCKYESSTGQVAWQRRSDLALEEIWNKKRYFFNMDLMYLWLIMDIWIIMYLWFFNMDLMRNYDKTWLKNDGKLKHDMFSSTNLNMEM